MTSSPPFGFANDLSYIRIDYVPGEGDPARVFRAMAYLIEAFSQIDHDLARSIDASIEPQLQLERVDAGSVRAWLRTVLRQLDDDALKNLDWKPLFGQYLVEAKHAVLRWVDKHDQIEAAGEIIQLQRELQRLAPPLPGGNPLLAKPVPSDRLLAEIKQITDAVTDLEPGDSVVYVSSLGETPLDTNLRISTDEIERLLTQEVVDSESEHLLLIKKPDYLGNSRWEFRLDDRSIEAKVLDKEWLEEFRAGRVPLHPGDALRARVRTEVYRGFEGQIVGTRQYVLKVIDVVHGEGETQISFLEEEP